ncbi:MAG: hypothetical protein SXV54_06000 [Chloroflexota bacterium]|nr:hypothetical protein [Chloroflexota bacterium]
MSKGKRTKALLVNSLLLATLAGLLIIYLGIVSSDIPVHVYTPEQYAYLSYNRSRIISQDAPVWNLVSPGDQIIPASLSEWETYVQAVLDAHYEEQEGIIVTVYDLDFHSEYHLAYPGPEIITTIELYFPFPGNLETLHDVRFLVDGAEPPNAQYALDGIRWQTEIAAGETQDIGISYKADGVSSFTYGLNHGRRSDVLDVNITVKGLAGSQVAQDSLPATNSATGTLDEGGATFTWEYENLIPSRDVQINLPTRMGFAQRVEQLQDDFCILAGLAPFLIGLFLVSLAGLFHLSGMRMPLANYLLAGLGLAFFYPLLTFLSGLVNVIVAATVSFLLVSGLVLLFLGLTAGWQRVKWRAGLLLFIFLGIFSLGTLTPWWRLLVTGGGLLLVGTFMLHYARRPLPSEPETPDKTSEKPITTPPDVEPHAEFAPEPVNRYCLHCGSALANDHAFCPGCGHDTSPFRHCANCGHEQFVPTDLDLVHCIRCGQAL